MTSFSPLPGIEPVMISGPRIRPLDTEKMDSVSLQKISESLNLGLSMAISGRSSLVIEIM